MTTLLVTEVFILFLGGALLSIKALVDITIIIILNTLVATLTLFCVSLFFKKLNAYSIFNSILGTLVGFLTGTLIEIGQLPVGFQYLVKLFPFSHSASLFRKILMDEPIKLVFLGANPTTINEFRQNMGIDLLINAKPINNLASILYLLAFGAICFLISFVRLRRKL